MNIPLQHQFNRATISYDQQAKIQRSMAHQLHQDIADYGPFSHLLEIGCGTGYSTRWLRDKYPTARIDALDLSPAMIAKAKQRCHNLSGLSFFVQDIEDDERLKESHLYDGIVSNATFQWLQQPQKTLDKLYQQLQPRGALMISTFGPKTFRELNEMFIQAENRHGLPHQKHQLSLVSSQEWGERFTKAGFQLLERKEELQRLSYSNCHHFLRSIRDMGANYTENQLSLGQMRKVLREVMTSYDEQYGQADGSVAVTYHLLHIYGRK